jgi:acetyltransferase-like isoleucine patch superfamily enzyme
VFLEVGFGWLWQLFPEKFVWIPILLVPFDILLMYYLFLLTAIGIMRIQLFILKLLHKPQEGIFPRRIINRDFKFFCLRNYARLFPSYLISSTPFPWFRRTLYFLAFGIKIGKYGINWDVWISPEFIDIGKNVIVGHSSVLLSCLLEEDKLIIKSIYIDDNAIIGAKSTLLPGTYVGKRTIIGAGSYTLPFQKLDSDSIYFGNPVEYVKKRDDIDFSLDNM